jgi:hypothetical protein
VAIDFPNSPALNEVFTSGDKTWVWNGSQWVSYRGDIAVTLDGTETLTNKTLVSPSLTGTPTAPTAAADTNTTQLATTEFVQTALASGGSITVSDTAPPTPESGNLWFDSSTGVTYIYYDSYWVEVGSSSVTSPTGAGSDKVFYENDQTITTNYTISTNKNAMTAGPITIAGGVTVTVPANSTWTVV